MPQLSLYLTEEQLFKVEHEAHLNKMSLSKWVVSQILNKIDPSYPEGWSELFGSIQDKSFCRPEQPELETREPL